MKRVTAGARPSTAPPWDVFTVNSTTGAGAALRVTVSMVATRPPICSICSAVSVVPSPIVTGPPFSIGVVGGTVGPVGPVGPTGPVGPEGPAATSFTLSPSQPARPIVAASASMAINGIRDRVIPRAPATFMDDSQTRSNMRRGTRPTGSWARRPGRRDGADSRVGMLQARIAINRNDSQPDRALAWPGTGHGSPYQPQAKRGTVN